MTDIERRFGAYYNGIQKEAPLTIGNGISLFTGFIMETVKSSPKCRAFVLSLSIMFCLIVAAVPRSHANDPGNPYPTVAIADYIFGCMAANGQTREALEKCSCSMDVIASILPYSDYEQAETVLSMRRLSGEKSTIFKTGARWKRVVDHMRRAQAEAEVRCF